MQRFLRLTKLTRDIDYNKQHFEEWWSQQSDTMNMMITKSKAIINKVFTAYLKCTSYSTSNQRICMWEIKTYVRWFPRMPSYRTGWPYNLIYHHQKTCTTLRILHTLTNECMHTNTLTCVWVYIWRMMTYTQIISCAHVSTIYTHA